MAYKITLSKKALEELDEAFTWYENEASKTVATRFLHEFYERMDEIIENPHRFQQVKKRPLYRRAILRKFPYHVVYRIDELANRIRVLVVWHVRRNPSDLMKRLRK